MAVKLVLKNSVQEDKRPTNAALEKGELAVNTHKSGPFLSVVDSAGNVQQVAGVKIGPSSPSKPVKGTQWLNTTDEYLYVYDGVEWIKVAGIPPGSAPPVSNVIGGDGISAAQAGGIWTLAFDYDTNRGIDIDAGQAFVRLKAGSGLNFDNGELFIEMIDGGTY